VGPFVEIDPRGGKKLNPIWTILAFSVSVFLVAHFLPAVHLPGFGTAIVVAIVYGVLNFLLYYLLVFLSLPFILVTFGLFLIVINAILLRLTMMIVPGFRIDGFFNTIVASVLISILNTLIRWAFPLA